VRGGFFPIHLAVLLNGDGFPDVSLEALGAWLRLRGLGEFLGGPVSLKALAKVGVTPVMLDELQAASMATEADGSYEAVGMPLYIKPSDAPERVRERMAASRAGVPVAEYREQREKEAKRIQSNPIQSRLLVSRVTERDVDNDDFLEGSIDDALRGTTSTDVAVKVVATLDGYEKLGMPNIPEIVEGLIADARKKNAPSVVVPTIEAWFKDWMVRAGVEVVPRGGAAP
jgi:hypothetical protein